MIILSCSFFLINYKGKCLIRSIIAEYFISFGFHFNHLLPIIVLIIRIKCKVILVCNFTSMYKHIGRGCQNEYNCVMVVDKKEMSMSIHLEIRVE